jgi:cytochrome c oxidase cbb3-type subunit IV
MYKLVLQGIEHVEIWPIIALILFLSVFIIGVAHAVFSDKNYIDHMENLPLDEEEKERISTENF